MHYDYGSRKNTTVPKTPSVENLNVETQIHREKIFCLVLWGWRNCCDAVFANESDESFSAFEPGLLSSFFHFLQKDCYNLEFVLFQLLPIEQTYWKALPELEMNFIHRVQQQEVSSPGVRQNYVRASPTLIVFPSEFACKISFFSLLIGGTGNGAMGLFLIFKPEKKPSNRVSFFRWRWRCKLCSLFGSEGIGLQRDFMAEKAHDNWKRSIHQTDCWWYVLPASGLWFCSLHKSPQRLQSSRLFYLPRPMKLDFLDLFLSLTGVSGWNETNPVKTFCFLSTATIWMQLSLRKMLVAFCESLHQSLALERADQLCLPRKKCRLHDVLSVQTHTLSPCQSFWSLMMFTDTTPGTEMHY